MSRSVVIKTPIPSVDEVAASLGMSKSRLRRIRQIVDGVYPPKTGNKRTAGSNLRHSDLDGHINKKPTRITVGTLRKKYGDSFLTDWHSNASLSSVRTKTGKKLVELVREHKLQPLRQKVSKPVAKTGTHAKAAS